MTSYHLETHSGDSEWVEVVGGTLDYLGTSYTVSNGVTAGATYYYRIRAYNLWGAGAYSSPDLSIEAKEPPSRITTPTTTIESVTGGLKIDWLAPSANGAPVTAYHLEV